LELNKLSVEILLIGKRNELEFFGKLVLQHQVCVIFETYRQEFIKCQRNTNRISKMPVAAQLILDLINLKNKN
jgi:hypothetical protein